MRRGKQKSSAQMIGDEAVMIVKHKLPRHWSAREYHPDYGLDLAIELFDIPETHPRAGLVSDTMGEHLFMQVKGTRKLAPIDISVRRRYNVEKPPPQLEIEPIEKRIRVISFQLDTPELITVQRMGAAVPVLLVVVDITTAKTYFVCLNDYIDKVLLPEDAAFAEKQSKVVHVPVMNELIDAPASLTAIRFYGKRAKFLAAFQKFSFQNHELAYVPNPDVSRVARHFAEIILRYDFWLSSEFWPIIRVLHDSLQRFLRFGVSGLVRLPDEVITRSSEEGAIWEADDGTVGTFSEMMECNAIRSLWRRLELLGRIHEEICREWFLPTHMGLTSSVEDFATNFPDYFTS
ncbi:MAG TPA: DUF4365 domain-containing protein [Bryobacteraceae bacterium]|nr:DUF4365 domain-containing protein [Bryobacteraceae bacterium]